MVVELKQISQKDRHEVELQKNHINKLNSLVNYKNISSFSKNLLKEFIFYNYLSNEAIQLKRDTSINFFLLSKLIIIHNSLLFKKQFILNFFLGFKAGEFFFTRAKFSYLKKNKKAIKR